MNDALLDSIHHADLFALCDQLEDASIDMILCDLPYGTTACSWDTVIPFAPMWERFKRVIKPRGAIVLTASQPFTSALVMSNVGMFRYEWVWNKVKPGNVFIGEYSPLRTHENILIFSVYSPDYSPIMTTSDSRTYKAYSSTQIISTDLTGKKYERSELYPKSIITFSNANQLDRLHPTQKPVALFEYLIRTYTREGDVVLDPCVGSGTTAVAARACKRHWICGDSSAEYVSIARDRMRLPFEPRSVKANDDVSDLPLFAQDAP